MRAAHRLSVPRVGLLSARYVVACLVVFPSFASSRVWLLVLNVLPQFASILFASIPNVPSILALYILGVRPNESKQWLAGAEGLEPPTFGFGDRRSAN